LDFTDAVLDAISHAHQESLFVVQSGAGKPGEEVVEEVGQVGLLKARAEGDEGLKSPGAEDAEGQREKKGRGLGKLGVHNGEEVGSEGEAGLGTEEKGLL
jgi:hypothetical protein